VAESRSVQRVISGMGLKTKGKDKNRPQGRNKAAGKNQDRCGKKNTPKVRSKDCNKRVRKRQIGDFTTRGCSVKAIESKKGNKTRRTGGHRWKTMVRTSSAEKNYDRLVQKWGSSRPRGPTQAFTIEDRNTEEEVDRVTKTD